MEKKYNFVYITTNLINGKQYIGDHSTDDLNSHKSKYYLGSGRPYLERAIKEYKRKNFKREILEFFDTKQEAFNAQEKYIQQYNTLVPNGYNISPKGGHDVIGGVSEETKQKISQKLKGVKHSEERRKNESLGQKGKIPWNKDKKTGPLSEEHKKLISKNGKGLKRKVGTGANISKGLKGRKLSLEHKQSISKIQRKVFRKCIYCGYEMTHRDFRRGHENKCKKKYVSL